MTFIIHLWAPNGQAHLPALELATNFRIRYSCCINNQNVNE